MIHAVFIIHPSGIPLFTQKLTEVVKGDEILFSGLMTAIFQFAKDVTKDKIRHLKIGNLTVLFDVKESMITTVGIDSSDPGEYAQEFLQTLSKNFLMRYESLLTPNSDIDSKFFDSFTEIMNPLIADYHNKLNGFSKTLQRKSETAIKLEGSLSLLNKSLKKNTEKAIHAAILGRQIIITGVEDEPLAKDVIDTLKMFYPVERSKMVEYWTDSHSTADLIGMQGDLKKIEDTYPTHVIVDLKKGEVIRGTSSKFTQKFIKDLLKTDSKKQIQIIKDFMSYLNGKIDLLINLLSNVKPEKEFYEEFKKEMDKDLLKIVITIATKLHPLFSTRLHRLEKDVSGILERASFL